MKKSLKCGLKAYETRVFIAIESGLGCEKRERGREFLIRFDRLLLRASINNTLISRKVQSEPEKNIGPSNDLCLRPVGGRQEATGEREGGPDRGRAPRSPNRNEPGASRPRLSRVSFGEATARSPSGMSPLRDISVPN